MVSYFRISSIDVVALTGFIIILRNSRWQKSSLGSSQELIKSRTAFGGDTDCRRVVIPNLSSSTILVASPTVRQICFPLTSRIPTHLARLAAIMPAMNQPARNYPLRPVNEPAIYVMGERQGQKVYPNAGGPGPVPIPPAGDRPGMNYGMPGMGMPGNQQAMLAHQNSSMEALERRGQRDRGQSMAMVSGYSAQCNAAHLSQAKIDTQRAGVPRMAEDDDSAGA